uniref:Uncharacterized protein n=1 Tax=Arundo donax TaxID=35708 RepID=A0A0A9F243_ARUDO
MQQKIKASFRMHEYHMNCTEISQETVQFHRKNT